jgi:type IV pilus assembly protein PilM
MAHDEKRPGVWGIDLGLCALKAIRLEEEDGEFKATAFDYIEHPKILSQPDADPDQLTREALEKFLSRNDLKGDQVAISVPGLNGLARFVKLPPVDEKKIPDIVRFEAKQQIPFPLHEVVWGFQRLGAGTKSANNLVMDAEVGLFAMKRDMINKSLQQFKDVGIEVHFIQMAPLSLCNFLAHDCLGKGPASQKSDDEEKAESDDECVVGLDIGTDNSSLVITDGEKIIWQRPIPLGGNHFTRALTKELKLTFAKAEHVKRNAIKSPDLKKILAALKPVLNDFVSEVQRSLGYFTNTHRDATIKYMVGLGNAFRLPGLQKYLQEKLQLEVKKLAKIQRLSGETSVTAAPQFTENMLSFGVAHGLALQGLGATCIYTNLLPPEIAQERAIRRKKPWAVAAAAVLLLMSPPLLIGYAATYSTWTSDGVKKARKKLSEVVSNSRADVDNYSMAEVKAQAARNKMLDLAGGVNERLNWVGINAFINEALPHPDGTHVIKAARNGARPYERYFTARAKDAAVGWPKLKAKLAEGIALTPDEQRESEEFKKTLVELHIESVVALYSDKIPASAGILFATAGVQVPQTGWVVEIRGYTYHEDKEVFVRNTLVENLIDLAELDPASRRLEVKLSTIADAAVHGKNPLDGTPKQLVFAPALYNNVPDYNPKPGSFYYIKQSWAGEYMKVMGPPVPAQATPGAPKKSVTPAGSYRPSYDVPTRLSWRPPMYTTIGVSFRQQAAPTSAAVAQPNTTPLQPVAPPAGTAITRAVRTEFIVAFVWQEPQAGK